MSNYAMNFEQVVLDALGGVYRGEDMLGLGDTNTWEVESYGFAGGKEYVPMTVIISLGASYYRVKKIATEKENYTLANEVNELLKRLLEAKKYGDYCQLVEDTKRIFHDYKVHDLVRGLD